MNTSPHTLYTLFISPFMSRACTQGRALGVLLYQGLPLKLDLDWKPAFPSDPLVSNLHSTGVTGLWVAHLVFHMGVGIWTQVLIDYILLNSCLQPSPPDPLPQPLNLPSELSHHHCDSSSLHPQPVPSKNQTLSCGHSEQSEWTRSPRYYLIHSLCSNFSPFVSKCLCGSFRFPRFSSTPVYTLHFNL